MRTKIYRLRLQLKLFSKVFYLTENELRLSVSPSHKRDGFATLHDVGYLSEEPLKSSFEKSLEGLSPQHKQNASEIAYRAHICAWAYNQTREIDGDILSFGVHFGILEKTIAELYASDTRITKSRKQFLLFDTWGDIAGGHTDYKDDIFNVARDRFKNYDFVQLIRGVVPNSFEKIQIPNVSLLFIDLNGWAAELAVLENFYSRVQPGGVIYFGDYGWNYPELRKVVTKFLSDKPESLLHFASGNAILVKK
jgi:hypothetical protein